MSALISELEAIRNAANMYGEALHNGDVELARKAFHPKALMYGYVPGSLMITEIQGLFDYMAASPVPAQSGEPHKYIITKIDCGGNTASVEMLQESYQGVDYINYFQLLRIDGNWVIVSKSFDVAQKHREAEQKESMSQLMEA